MVNLTDGFDGVKSSSAIWILNNGTAIAIYSSEEQKNITGGVAQQSLPDTLSVFGLLPQLQGALTDVGSSLLASPPGSVTFGQTHFLVTNFSPKSLPITVDYCSGVVTFTSLSLQTGAPSSSQVVILTYFSGTYAYGTTNSSALFEVTGVTLA